MSQPAVDVSDSAVQDAWKQLTNDKSPVNWSAMACHCRCPVPGSVSAVLDLLSLPPCLCSVVSAAVSRGRILLGLADGGKSNKLELVEASTAGFVELKKKSHRTHSRQSRHRASRVPSAV